MEVYFVVRTPTEIGFGELCLNYAMQAISIIMLPAEEAVLCSHYVIGFNL